MELFSASGIDLPLAGGPSKCGPAALARSLRMPLLNYKLVEEARSLVPSPSAASAAAARRHAHVAAVRHRLLDLARSGRRKLNGKLEAWHERDFASFQVEVRKVFRADIAIKQRAEREAHLTDNAREVHRLTAEIAEAEKRIDAIVFRLFGLTPDEIVLLQASIAGRS